MATPGQVVAMNVDISEVVKSAELMKSAFSVPNFTRILHDTNADTAKFVRSIVGKVANDDFQVTQRWAKNHVGHWKTMGAYGVVIPMDGARGVIGKTFPMKIGRIIGAKTKAGRMDRRRRLKAAKIKRGQWSNLPSATPHQGGNPIFPINGVAATRTDKRRIARVVGRSLPQMIVNSPARPKAEEQIEKRMMERFNHNVERALRNWA